MWDDNSMIESIGIYTKLFDASPNELQQIIPGPRKAIRFSETGPTIESGVSTVSFGKDLVEIDRRSGEYHTRNHVESEDWHQEGTYDALIPSIMAWSNIHPTELKLPDESIVVAKPFELMMVDNQKVMHRTPSIPIEDLKNRQFITIRFWWFTPTQKQLSKFRKALARFE